MDIDDFQREANKARYFLDKGRLNDGCAYAVAACYHAYGEEEPAWLRDLRCDFLLEILTKLEGCKQCSKTRQMARHLQALLDRRVFNHKFGKGLEKGLFPSSKTLYDPGYDKHVLPLREYVGNLPCAAPSETRYVEWMLVATCAVAREVHVRKAIQKNKFRIGAAVFAHGLLRFPQLNECIGVLNRRQDARWAIHFVNGSCGLLREQNLEAHGEIRKRKQDVITQLASIINQIDGIALRHDVAARTEFAKECVQSRCLQKMKCCAWCAGDGWVDFYTLYYDRLEHLSPNDLIAERILRFKEFFLSGLCQMCQQKIFN